MEWGGGGHAPVRLQPGKGGDGAHADVAGPGLLAAGQHQGRTKACGRLVPMAAAAPMPAPRTLHPLPLQPLAAPADGKTAAGLYVHQQTSQAVGVAIAAFARCMLAAQTQPGVWFPEERGALADRRALLALAAQGTSRFELNRTPWQLQTDPVQVRARSVAAWLGALVVVGRGMGGDGKGGWRPCAGACALHPVL